MDIESALKNIGDWISEETELRKYPKGELLALSESLQALKAEIARQSVKSEEVQREINRLTDALKQTKEAAKELKEQKYAVNMLPVYDQIKSLELQITALQAYQPWVSVKDRLPTKDTTVIVCFDDGFIATVTYGADWELWSDSGEPTHWKPLPEPPKGE